MDVHIYLFIYDSRFHLNLSPNLTFWLYYKGGYVYHVGENKPFTPKDGAIDHSGGNENPSLG